jgi:hypothetical protein
MCQEPIKLIKCLYNKSTHSPLRFSDKCLYAYKNLYEEEPKINYNGTHFSIDPKIINLIEELGIEKSGGFGAYLAFQLVPEELKEYIVVGFVEGTRKVYIDYDKAFANILHENHSNYEHTHTALSFFLHKLYEKYNRIAYIKEKYDILMTQTLDKAYEYPFICKAGASDAGASED